MGNIKDRNEAGWLFVSAGYGLVIGVLSLFHLWLNRGTIRADMLEVSVPLVASVLFAVIVVRSIRRRSRPIRLRRLAKWSFGSLAVSGVIGGWWVALEANSGGAIAPLTDQLLVLASLGLVCGLAIGTGTDRADAPPTDPSPEKGTPERLEPAHAADRPAVAERAWAHRTEGHEVVVAVARAIADAEGVDPWDLPFAIHDYIDVDLLGEMVTQDGPWQLQFAVDGYEVHISSYGTVSVYPLAGV